MTARALIEGPLNVAVVGAGRWGKNLIRVFGAAERCRVVAICDPDPARLADYAAHPTARCYPSVFRAINETVVDAVVIATPSPSHFQLAATCLELDKHVFVEKPMTLASADSATLVGIARQRRRRLMVGHVLRHHPAVLALGELVEDGELGVLRAIRSERRGPPPECAEGLWWSVSPHDVSVARWLLREDARTVSARSYGSRASERIEARLAYSEGRSAIIVASCSDGERSRRTELTGTRGTAVLEDSGSGAKLTVFRGAPSLASAAESVATPAREPLACEAEHFVRAILDGRPLTTDAHEGHRVVQTLEAGSASMALGGAACQIGAGVQGDAAVVAGA